MAYYDFLSFIFGPLINASPLFAVVVISLIFSFLNLVITKYTTNQTEMKRIKEQMDGYRKDVKELRKDPSKSAEMQKKMLDMNKLTLEQVKYSMKPLIITTIPIIFLLIPWMNSVLAYESIKPQQEFSVTVFFEKNANGMVNISVGEGMAVIDDKTKNIENSKSTWSLKGDEGEHVLEFVYGGENQQKSVLITSTEKYIEPAKKANSAIKSIQIDYKPKKILNLFGWKLGWLGSYVVFSLVFAMALRKVMKVY